MIRRSSRVTTHPRISRQSPPLLRTDTLTSACLETCRLPRLLKSFMSSHQPAPPPKKKKIKPLCINSADSWVAGYADRPVGEAGRSPAVPLQAAPVNSHLSAPSSLISPPPTLRPPCVCARAPTFAPMKDAQIPLLALLTGAAFPPLAVLSLPLTCGDVSHQTGLKSGKYARIFTPRAPAPPPRPPRPTAPARHPGPPSLRR